MPPAALFNRRLHQLLRDKKGSSVRKKKAVIACVRLLFIDLWRLNTGRTTLDALGLKARPKAKPLPAIGATEGE